MHSFHGIGTWTGLLGAIPDTILVVGLVAETAGVAFRAAQFRGLVVHVADTHVLYTRDLSARQHTRGGSLHVTA